MIVLNGNENNLTSKEALVIMQNFEACHDTTNCSTVCFNIIQLIVRCINTANVLAGCRTRS